MPVATAMVLMMNVFAIRIVAPVGMHTYGSGMAAMQFGKHLPAIIIKRE